MRMQSTISTRKTCFATRWQPFWAQDTQAALASLHRHSDHLAVAPPNMRRNSRVAGCEEMQLIYSEVAGNCSGKSGSSGRWAEENCCCRKLLLQFLLFLCARRNVCNIIFALLAAAG